MLRDENEYIKNPGLYQIIIDILYKKVYNYTHAQLRAVLKGKIMYYVSPRNRLKLAISAPFMQPWGIWDIWIVLSYYYFFISETITWLSIGALAISVGYAIHFLLRLCRKYTFLLQFAHRTGLNTSQLRELRYNINDGLYQVLLEYGTRQDCDGAMSLVKCSQVLDVKTSQMMQVGYDGLRARLLGEPFDVVGKAGKMYSGYSEAYTAAENFKFGDEPPIQRKRPPMVQTPSSPPGHARDRRLRLA